MGGSNLHLLTLNPGLSSLCQDWKWGQTWVGHWQAASGEGHGTWVRGTEWARQRVCFVVLLWVCFVVLFCFLLLLLGTRYALIIWGLYIIWRHFRENVFSYGKFWTCYPWILLFWHSMSPLLERVNCRASQSILHSSQMLLLIYFFIFLGYFLGKFFSTAFQFTKSSRPSPNCWCYWLAFFSISFPQVFWNLGLYTHLEWESVSLPFSLCSSPLLSSPCWVILLLPSPRSWVPQCTARCLGLVMS